MRLIITTAISLFFAGFIFAQTNENADESNKQCVLAESISAEFQCAGNTNVLTEDSLRNRLKTKKTSEIIDDISAYADIFEKWAKTSLPSFQTREEMTGAGESNTLSAAEIRAHKVKIFKEMWNRGTEPITKYGAIISIEMSELAARHETDAKPYLIRIADAKLPKELGVPKCARVKSQYQNPAAEAWLKLTMPKDISDTDAKIWLTNFIAGEKAKAAEKKAWAVEAGERMLRNMEKESQSSASSNVVTNVPK